MSSLPKFTRLIIVAVLLTSSVFGQSSSDPRLKQAQAFEEARDFEQAFLLYEKIHKDDKSNNALTFKLAGMAYQLKNFKAAEKYYKILAPNGNPTVLYNLACSLALQGKKRSALKYLETAVEKGFNQVKLMKSDTDLASLHGNKKFEQIVKSIKSIENHPEAQKFDFWVGEWDVYNTTGQKVGESVINKILKDAVILENWTGSGGFTGKSFNHYLLDSEKWVQYWVDQGSNRIHYEGNFDPEQNAIVYIDQNQAKSLNRLTFFNISADSVRQFSQQSVDEGQTWTVQYDFMYVRKGTD